MLSLQQTKSPHGICKPNILPCRINHNGPVNASKRYWNPTTSNLNNDLTPAKTTAYFRGKKLEGKTVQVPGGYKGVVVANTERVLASSKIDAGDVGVDVEEEEGDADEYVRGVEEWIGFAETIHRYSKEGDEKDPKGS